MSHPIAQQFAGFALAERERNLRDDSYFVLTVWNPDTLEPESFEYAATAYPSAPMHPSTVQQLLGETHESVHAAHHAWRERAERAASVRVLLLDLERGAVFAGDRVRVARGRKVPKGIEGKVLRVESRVVHTSKYGTWQTKEDFALIETERGFWTVAARHLDVIERGQVMQQIFDMAG